MHDKLWFKRRRFGWGWTPVTTAGWATVIAFVAAVTFLAREFANDPPVFCTGIMGVTALLIAVCFAKGEPPKWQWGDKR